MRVVVTMTTVPWRLGSLVPTLRSIRDQGNFDRFVLNCPDRCGRNNESYDVPSEVESLVEVVRCGRDLGSATKLLPTLNLERDPDTLLVTADDDVLYGPGWLSGLVEWAQRAPDYALGYMGATFSKGGFVHGEQVGFPTSVEVLGGYRGIAYRRRFFGDDVFDKIEGLLRDGPFLIDDHFFAGYLWGRCVGRCVIPSSGQNFQIRGLGGGIYDGDGPGTGGQRERLVLAMRDWGVDV